MYYDRETRVMVNKSVNEFYTRFLLAIDVLPQDIAFLLDVAATFLNNLSPEVRDLFISKGVRVPSRPPTENNYQVNHRLILVRNVAVEAENKIRTIKSAVQPAIRSRHPETCLVILAGNPSTQISGLGSSFKSEESNSMVA